MRRSPFDSSARGLVMEPNVVSGLLIGISLDHSVVIWIQRTDAQGIVKMLSGLLGGRNPCEAVSNRPLGEYIVRVLRVVIQLFPQAADIGLKIVHVAPVFVAPHSAEKHVEGEYTPGVS